MRQNLQAPFQPSHSREHSELRGKSVKFSRDPTIEAMTANHRWKRESPREKNADLMGGGLEVSQQSKAAESTDQSVQHLKQIRRARDLVFVST